MITPAVAGRNRRYPAWPGRPSGDDLPAEYLIPGHVAEDVIRDIASWVPREALTRACRDQKIGCSVTCRDRQSM